MAYMTEDCPAACEPRGMGCVELAANEIESTSHRLSGLVGDLTARLTPVITPPRPDACGADKPPEYPAPLAKGLQSVDARLRGVETAIRDLLDRLEI